MSGMACHHCLWAKHMVRLRRVWQEIIYLGQHIQLKNVERFMLLSSLDFTHSRTTSGMACPHVPWAANAVRRHQARHSIIALGQHTRSDDVACVMLSLPWDRTHGQTASGVACKHIPKTSHTVAKRRVFHPIVVFELHTRSDDVRHGMPACPLGTKHCQTTSGKAFHPRP